MRKILDILSRAIEQLENQNAVMAHSMDAPELESVIDVSLGDIGSDQTILENAITDYLNTVRTARTQNIISFFIQALINKPCWAIGLQV